jgi:hypothetical protein
MVTAGKVMLRAYKACWPIVCLAAELSITDRPQPAALPPRDDAAPPAGPERGWCRYAAARARAAACGAAGG